MPVTKVSRLAVTHPRLVLTVTLFAVLVLLAADPASAMSHGGFEPLIRLDLVGGMDPNGAYIDGGP